MNITIIIILLVAIGLIIFSYVKQLEQTKNLEKQIDHITFLVTDELYKMNEKLVDTQLDLEVTTNEKNYLEMDAPIRILLKKMIIMHRAGYSIDSIAKEFQLSNEEVESMLEPYKVLGKRDA